MNWTRPLPVVCALALGFPAGAEAATQTIEGQPSPSPRVLSIFIGDTGSLQAKGGVPVVGQPAEPQPVAGMFFGASTAPAANYWHLRVKAGPSNNTTFGPRDTPVTAVSNGPVTGDWTAASPARVETIMRAGADLFEIKQTTLYVGPESRFRVVWDVRNISAQTLAFVFGTSADLFIGSDAGSGVLLAGPPRFIGGTNKFSGTTGGIEEVTSSQLPGEPAARPVAPWASYEEGDPFGVTHRLSGGDAFSNTINPAFMDNGVGVSFNDRATAGLAAGETARYEVIWHLSRSTAAARSAPAVGEASAPASPAVPPSPADRTGVDSALAPGAARLGDGPADDGVAPAIGVARSQSAARSSVARTAGGPRIAFRLSEAAAVVVRIARQAAARAQRAARSGTVAR
jgi:hypothetical protein